ncbi:MAG: Ni/Fe hydrogenase subunit alpha [Synergistetes bacterium]|nr:Ni/Fe hydrogenase subunit alpha [Synergistota bacterium]
MAQKLEIFPVTRVEGHGKVTIYLNDAGEVEKTYFHVTQVRGFEKFCEGRVFWEMPVITQRACGICPVSHHLASAKATDKLLGVEIPPTAKKLRELMHMGQIVQSHSLHFFHLASPDLLFGMDADPKIRNVVGVVEKHPDLALRGVKLRKYGQEVIKILGGKRIHPRFAIPGGVSKGLSVEERDSLLKDIDWVISELKDTVKLIRNLAEEWGDKFRNFASFPSLYMGLVDEKGNLDLYHGKIRLCDYRGKIIDEFSEDNYLEKIGEWVEPWSYMKFPFYKDFGYPEGSYRVGPLGRINCCDDISTPLAKEELKIFRDMIGSRVAEGSLFYHYARMIEALHAAEKLKELLEDPDITGTELRAVSRDFNPEGVGVLEAPRGTLIHHYKINESGEIIKANLIVATVNNNNAMNKAVELVAKEYIKGPDVKEGFLNMVEVAIRCYDPCLSCATHALGKMPLEILIYDSEGNGLRKLVRDL